MIDVTIWTVIFVKVIVQRMPSAPKQESIPGGGDFENGDVHARHIATRTTCYQ